MQINNIGITANGNYYKKSSIGKKAGFLAGGIMPTIASLIKVSQIKDSLGSKRSNSEFGDAVKKHIKNVENPSKNFFDNFKISEKLLTKNNIKTGAIVACAIIGSTIVGTLLGNLYDKFVNKERAAEADGMEKLKNNLKM